MLYHLASFIATGAIVVAASIGERFEISDTVGGPGGTPFNDYDSLPGRPRVQSITLRGNKRLDAIKFVLTDGKSFEHGGSGGNPVTLNLGLKEYITSIKLCEGSAKGSSRIFYAGVATSDGRTLSSGRMTRNCRDIAPPAGFGVVGAMGRSAQEVDQIGFISANQQL